MEQTVRTILCVVTISLRQPAHAQMGKRVLRPNPFQTRGRLCFRCKKPGHVAGECSRKFCIRCLSFGHEEETCLARHKDHRPACSNCAQIGHVAKDCRYQRLDTEPRARVHPMVQDLRLEPACTLCLASTNAAVIISSHLHTTDTCPNFARAC